MAAMKTSVTELPESRVRVEAEVPAEEVERRLQQTARVLGRQMKLPGFRKGKVPPPMVVQRVGRAAVLDETVRDALPGWYVSAIEEAGVVPVGDPQLDLSELPDEGQPLHFSIEIGVRPRAQLGEYRGLEVGRREPEVADEAVDAELERLRDRLARLEAVDEPAADGDFVVIDYTGTVEGEPLPGGEARDELVELGKGTLAEEMEAALVGARAGDSREVEVAFPAEHRSPEVAGRTGRFSVAVKEVKRKQLPDLDDDFAADAAGFDSLADLRTDVRAKMQSAEESAIDAEFREAAVDAAVANAAIEVPEPLVEARAREMWHQLAQTLQRQNIAPEMYLQISGKTEEQMIEEARPDAERALRRDAVLAAVVEEERIEPSEDDLLVALEHSAEHENTTPAKLLARLRESGRLDALRRDLAVRQAVDLLAEHAKPIAAERAEARERLWTPDKEAPGGPPKAAAPAGSGELWTPGS